MCVCIYICVHIYLRMHTHTRTHTLCRAFFYLRIYLGAQLRQACLKLPFSLDHCTLLCGHVVIYYSGSHWWAFRLFPVSYYYKQGRREHLSPSVLSSMCVTLE